MAADFWEQELLPPNLQIMKGKGAFNISVTEDRLVNGSVIGDLKLKIAKCIPFKIYISNEMTGGVNMWDLGALCHLGIIWAK